MASKKSQNKTAKNQEELIKTQIPRALYMSIIKIQASKNLDWKEACLEASKLIDSNSEEFKHLVETTAQRIYQSRHMTELNKTISTVKKKAYEEGYEDGWEDAMQIDHFRVPCSICGEPMIFKSTDPNWEKAKKYLYDAFKTWYHTACKKK